MIWSGVISTYIISIYNMTWHEWHSACQICLEEIASLVGINGACGCPWGSDVRHPRDALSTIAFGRDLLMFLSFPLLQTFIINFKSFNFGSVSSLWESQNSRSASAWSYWPQVDLFAGKLQQSSNSIHRIHRILLHSASFKSERGPDSVHCPSNLEPFNVFYTSIIFYNII